MKNIAVLILTVITNVSFGQTESAASKTVTETFIENYNTKEYKAIFSMFSSAMKETFPEDKTLEFLSSLQLQAGNITNHAFLKYEDKTYASYKTTFERAICTLKISIDEHSKINGLFVKPYVEEAASEGIINALSFEGDVLSKEQAALIFNSTKVFPDQTQIAFAIIKKGKVSFYGVKRKVDTLLTLDNHKSIFEIGSITKVFTSTLLSGFVVDEKVKLNDNISSYLNFPLNNNVELSLKELSNHTSGLARLPSNLNLATADITNPYKEYGENELEEFLTKHVAIPQESIGHYQYSNLGAGLLGHVLSTIEGRSFENLLQDKIFSKYNMLNSTSLQSKVAGVLVKGLNAQGNEVPNWEFSVLAGAGGILSSVEDLSKFALAQFESSNVALALTRQKTFEINDNMSIGLGWHIIKASNEDQWTWHNGGTAGYSSSMAIDVTNKNGVVILSNVSAFNPSMGNIDQLCFQLMKTLKE